MADRSYVRTYPHDSLRHFDKLLGEVGAIFNQTRLQNMRLWIITKLISRLLRGSRECLEIYIARVY